MRSFWLAKKAERSVALRMLPDHQARRVDFEIIRRQAGKWQAANGKPLDGMPQFDGTVRRGSATCPVCGYTTPVASVRRQLKARRGGAADARLFCVVTTRPGEQGRFYRLPTEADLGAVRKAAAELERRKAAHTGPLSLVPDEEISLNEIRRMTVPLYGMMTWESLFTPRQALALTTFARLIQEFSTGTGTDSLMAAMQTCLALALDKEADLNNGLTGWKQDAECPVHLFARQAIPMVWDFAEAVPISESSGSWQSMYERTAYSIEQGLYDQPWIGHISNASATDYPLPNDSAHAFVTDPPYYDAVPYAYLSDFVLVSTILNISMVT